MPKAVIFGVDGTLIDTVALHARAWEDTFRHFGHKVPAERVRGQIGKGADQLMPVFVEASEVAKHGEEMERFRANRFRDYYLPKARGFPGVRELFKRIRAQGSAIALASSCKADELDGYMELAGIPDLVDAKTTSDDARTDQNLSLTSLRLRFIAGGEGRPARRTWAATAPTTRRRGGGGAFGLWIGSPAFSPSLNTKRQLTCRFTSPTRPSKGVSTGTPPVSSAIKF